MTKPQLLASIINTYIQLRPSPIAGIGVFAIRDIPKGCRDMFSEDKGEWIKVPKPDIDSLPEYAQKVVHNYCTFDDDFYYVEDGGFKKMDLACFVNHSETPNIFPVNDGQYFEALTEIKQDEELFIDYSSCATY